MDTLKIVRNPLDKDDKSNLRERTAVRGVLFDKDGLLPILFVQKHNYHKLPGGGIENDENHEKALLREVKEETGSEIEINEGIGKIIEFKIQLSIKQTSYCYLGKIKSKGTPKFTQKEINNGFKLVWLSLNDAIKTLKNDQPNDYQGKFIQERDLTFLKKAFELINN